MEKKATGSCDSGNVIENTHENAEPFRCFMHLLSDKTAATLKSTALVANPLHAILLNVSARKRRRLIGTRHTLVGFLPVCCTQEQMANEGSGVDEEMLVF